MIDDKASKEKEREREEGRGGKPEERRRGILASETAFYWPTLLSFHVSHLHFFDLFLAFESNICWPPFIFSALILMWKEPLFGSRNSPDWVIKCLPGYVVEVLLPGSNQQWLYVNATNVFGPCTLESSVPSGRPVCSVTAANTIFNELKLQHLTYHKTPPLGALHIRRPNQDKKCFK